jgi:hypothetical protein
MSTPLGNCQTRVSTIFVFDRVEVQNAANGIYLGKKGDLTSSVAGTLLPGVNHNVKLVFKTDYERMQYLMGLYGQTSKGAR